MFASKSGGKTVAVIALAAIYAILRLVVFSHRKYVCNTYRSDDCSTNVVLGTLACQRLGEGDETHLSGAVVRLAEVTYD